MALTIASLCLSANTNTIKALRSALEKCGVVFVSENGGPAGVRFKKKGT
jgi:hypothetical protein